jgi:hypothetical protein
MRCQYSTAIFVETLTRSAAPSPAVEGCALMKRRSGSTLSKLRFSCRRVERRPERESKRVEGLTFCELSYNFRKLQYQRDLYGPDDYKNIS